MMDLQKALPISQEGSVAIAMKNRRFFTPSENFINYSIKEPLKRLQFIVESPPISFSPQSPKKNLHKVQPKIFLYVLEWVTDKGGLKEHMGIIWKSCGPSRSVENGPPKFSSKGAGGKEVLLRFQASLANSASLGRNNHVGEPPLELVISVDGAVAKFP